MSFVERTLSWQRGVLGALLAVSAVGFWRGTFDVFNTFKATLIALGVLALLVIAAVRASRTRRLHLPPTPVLAAVTAFAVALVAATAVSDTPMLSVVGRAGRHTGLAMYAIYVALMLVALRLHRDRAPTGLVAWLLGAAVPVVIYALLQAVGVDPFHWQTVEGGPPVFSTFGNANFFAAWAGMIVPLAVWAAVRERTPPALRAGAVLLALGAFASAALSGSLQGPVVALAGAVLVLAVYPFATSGRLHGMRVLLVTGGAVVGLVAVGAVVVGVGPLARVREAAAASMGTRTGKWQAAVSMFRDHPLLGVGLDDYADYFHAYRPVAVAAQDGLRRTTDAPHNVVLDMLASGGLVLALTYVAVLAVTAWALVHGLRRRAGQDRLLLAGLGGAWLAYQLQALVSIDVPPLAALHWALSGAIIGFATRPQLREILLPGARKAPPQTRPGAKRGKAARQRPSVAPLAPLPLPALAAVAAATVLGVVAITWPLRADLAAGAAVHLVNAGNPESAVDAYVRAARTGSWESRYPLQLGGLLLELGRPEEALEAFRDAQRREPRSLNAAINVAHTAESLADPDAAAAYELLLELDPRTPDVMAEVGRYRLATGDAEGAAELLERAVTLRADNAGWWVVLGRARSSEGDRAGAREAFERALDLDPEAPGAREGLDGLA